MNTRRRTAIGRMAAPLAEAYRGLWQVLASDVKPLPEMTREERKSLLLMGLVVLDIVVVGLLTA